MMYLQWLNATYGPVYKCFMRVEIEWNSKLQPYFRGSYPKKVVIV